MTSISGAGPLSSDADKIAPPESPQSAQTIDFMTMGMFIIDEIHFTTKSPVFDILGGAGSYSALGARLFSPSIGSRNKATTNQVAAKSSGEALDQDRALGDMPSDMEAVGPTATTGKKLVSSFFGYSSRSVGWIVDAGSDFPENVRKEIEGWETTCLIRNDKERLTTRGWNGYEGKGEDRCMCPILAHHGGCKLS
jgi:hypothetical protein